MLKSRVNKLIAVILIISGSAFLVQCGDDGTRQMDEGSEEAMESDNLNQDQNQDMAQEGNFQQDRDELAGDMRDLRDDIDNRLDELDSEMGAATGDVDQETQERYDELTQDRDELDQSIEELENSTEDTWSRVQGESQNTYDAVRTRFEQAGNENDLVPDENYNE